jgi:hypothetical protein
MALVVKDRVKQTTTTTGTGNIVLNGNIDGFQTFAAALANGDTTYYGIFVPSTNDYEVGLGTWTEGSATLARTTVLESSNSGNAINITAQAEVFITQPAEKAVYLNGSDVAELGDGLKVDSSSGSITITAEDGSGNIDVNLPRDNISPLSTITVTVVNSGGNKYALDGTVQQTAILKPSVTYRFDQSDSSNSGHPLRFSTTSNGTHVGGSEFTTGVTTSGSAGSAGAYTEVRFEQDVAAKLYYYCSAHSGMGGAAEIKSISTTGGTFTGAVIGTDLTLSGDLTVNGTTTTVNTTNMVVSDALIELANGTTGTPANDAGLVIERGDSNNAFIGFDESADKFIVGTGSFTGASTGDLTISTGTLVANVEGNVTGNVTGNVSGSSGSTTGNAATATALATARNIGGVSFDGTGNIDLAGVNTAGNQNTSGNAATATALATARNIGGVSFDGTGNINLPGVNTSGNQDTSGNAATATTAGTVTTAAQPNITSLGTLTTLTVDDITINGSTISDGGDFTIDVGGDIIFDADGGDFKFQDNGSAIFHILTSATETQLFNQTDNADILLKGVDGGAAITALTLDMSDAGTATFNHDIKLGDNGKAIFGAGSDLEIYHDASNSYIKDGGTGNLLIQGSDLILEDPDGNNYIYCADGSAVYLYYNGSNKLNTTSSGVNIEGELSLDNIYVADKIYHEGDTDTYIGFVSNGINFYTGGSHFAQFNTSGLYLNDSALAEDYDALSGTTPTINVANAGAFSLTTSGNTTFTFSNTTSGYAQGFVLQVTAGGSHTLTWPNTVDWAGGSAPDAPASGESNLYSFYTRDGGSNWIGVLSAAAYA